MRNFHIPSYTYLLFVPGSRVPTGRNVTKEVLRGKATA